jgi:hypothetical protein
MYLLQDGITREVYVKWYGLEDRVEWREQLENSALLGLDAGKLLLERLRQLVLGLKKLHAEESRSISSSPQRASDYTLPRSMHRACHQCSPRERADAPLSL